MKNDANTRGPNTALLFKMRTTIERKLKSSFSSLFPRSGTMSSPVQALATSVLGTARVEPFRGSIRYANSSSMTDTRPKRPPRCRTMARDGSARRASSVVVSILRESPMRLALRTIALASR